MDKNAKPTDSEILSSTTARLNISADSKENKPAKNNESSATNKSEVAPASISSGKTDNNKDATAEQSKSDSVKKDTPKEDDGDKTTAEAENSKSPSSETNPKKFKQENPPSKVVHLRNLPLPPHQPYNNQYNNATYHAANDDVEGEIIKKAFAFGPVIDILLMRKSGQAFLQMETLDQGKKFVEEHKDKPLDIGTHSVYIQFSKHQELTDIDDNPHQQQIRQRLEDARKGIFTTKSSPIKNFNHNSTPFQPSKSGHNWSENNSNSFANSPAKLNTGNSNGSNNANNQTNSSISNSNTNNATGDNNQNNSSSPVNADQRILHVVIEKELPPPHCVKIHEYYDHFSRYGDVCRIVMFRKQSSMQAKSSQQVLIEMKSGLAAQTAYMQYNGKNMKQDGHTMRIDYSKLPELTVKSDGDTRWDYTRTARPPPEESSGIASNNTGMTIHQSGQPNFRPNNNHHPGNQNIPHIPAGNWAPPNAAGSQGSGDNRGPMHLQPMHTGPHPGGQNHPGNSPHPNQVTASPMGHQFNFAHGQHHMPGGQHFQNHPAQYYGQVPYNGAMMHQFHHHMQGQALAHGHGYYDPRAMQLHNQQLGHHGHNMPPQHPHAHSGAHIAGNPQALQPDHIRMTQMLPAFPGQHNQSQNNSSSVLCASNLNEDKAKPDDLFTLFGVYGDVQRVKILYEKRDTALIEFQQPQQAEQAIKNLNNKKLYGKELKLRLSKFQKVNMPKEGADTFNLTKEYLNSPLHRYRKSGSKNYLNIYEPCDVLHLSNIPEGKSEEEIKSIFEKHGTVKQFKFFKDTKMALIKVDSIEEAIHCLIKTHNHRMSANQHLRVSFSKGYLT